MSLRSYLDVLRWVGLAVCAGQICAAAAIPIATYILFVKPYERFAIENYVHWGVSLVAGGWGMMALGCMRPVALAIHVVLGSMVAAALSAQNVAEYADLELRCATNQQAFLNCAACPCAALNACTATDYASGGSCPSCSAPSAEFCSDFRITHNKIMLAVTGPVTVFLMAIPVIFSLLALLKVECASGLEISNRVARAMSIVNEQLVHLNAREDLTLPLDQLMESIRQIEREGAPATVKLAGQCRTALARAGFNVPPLDYDEPKKGSKDSITVVASPPSFAPSHASHHSLHSVAQLSQASMNASGMPLLHQENWNSPHASIPRPPQPAAMTFPTNNPEDSIYYNPTRRS